MRAPHSRGKAGLLTLSRFIILIGERASLFDVFLFARGKCTGIIGSFLFLIDIYVYVYSRVVGDWFSIV